MARRWPLITGLSVVAVGIGVSAEERLDSAGAKMNFTMFDPRTVKLEPAPLPPGWILDGHPDAAAAQVDQAHDGSTRLFVWRVGAGRFNWFYDFDETVTILDGEVYLSDGANAAPRNAGERRLGPGDVVFFHVGSTATWRVPEHVRKIATVKRPLPGPIGTLIRVAKKARDWLVPERASASPL